MLRSRGGIKVRSVLHQVEVSNAWSAVVHLSGDTLDLVGSRVSNAIWGPVKGSIWDQVYTQVLLQIARRVREDINEKRLL